jgi:hypothetical protein
MANLRDSLSTRPTQTWLPRGADVSSITLDGLHYEADGVMAFCRSSMSAVWELPRNCVVVAGLLVEIEAIHAHDRRHQFDLPVHICVPSSVQKFAHNCFLDSWRLSTVTFEFGSSLSRIEESAFAICLELSSICIPSSVETVCRKSFSGCSSRGSSTFESGSQRSSIADFAFAECSSLSSICLPPELKQFSGLARVRTDVCDISLADGNCHLKVCGDFLLDFEGVSIKRYFGNMPEMAIQASVKELDVGCFAGCQSVVSVEFEPGSQLTHIRDQVCSMASALSSICIPSSLRLLGKGCFQKCDSFRK